MSLFEGWRVRNLKPWPITRYLMQWRHIICTWNMFTRSFLLCAPSFLWNQTVFYGKDQVF